MRKWQDSHHTLTYLFCLVKFNENEVIHLSVVLVALYMILSLNPTGYNCKSSFPHTDEILWEE